MKPMIKKDIFKITILVSFIMIFAIALTEAEAQVPAERILLVDFGATELENEFEGPEWNTVMYSSYTAYTKIGSKGLGLTAASRGSTRVNYQGIQGTGRNFVVGEKIIITWYNASDTEQIIIPQVSFEDSDYTFGGATGDWYGMSKTKIPPFGTAQSLLEINDSTEGHHTLINVNVHLPGTMNERFTNIICDKIELGNVDLDPDTIISFPLTTRTITANVYTGHGTITPSAEWGEMVDVHKGDDLTFYLHKEPEMTDYRVFVDEEDVTSQVVNDSYTFHHVTKDHTLSVGFIDRTRPIHTIEITHGPNGTMAPTGTIEVNHGEDAWIKYVPERNYTYDYPNKTILVDGVNVALDKRHSQRSAYWLENVTEDHTLYMEFGYYITKEYKTLEELNLWTRGDPVSEGTISPGDIEYLGAFRTPETAGWPNHGGGFGFYPEGDRGASNPEDDYPGSIFAIGGYVEGHATEISIPEPVISKDVSQLNKARELQPFSDIANDPTEETHGLTYISSQDKLFFGQGNHSYWNDDKPSLGWFNRDLANHQTKGLWHLGGVGEDGIQYMNGPILENTLSLADSGYIMFEIPQNWANRYLDGKKILATGRSTPRSHLSLYALAPWEEDGVTGGDWDEQEQAPYPGGKVKYMRLLDYNPVEGQVMENYGWGDNSWDGAAWVEAGNTSALILGGIHGYGLTFYNGGTTYPEGVVTWNDNAKVVLKFYDPKDLAAVVQGNKQPHEPQAYATLDITPYMIRANDYLDEVRFTSFGGMAYDRARNLLYVSERRVYGGTRGNSYPVIHVFKVGNSGNPYSSYFGFEEIGGTWHDAELSQSDEMFWAAAAANILKWTNWDTPVYDTAQKILENIKEHWTNDVGLVKYGWQWWVNDYEPTETETLSQVDDSGEGNYWPEYNFFDYLYEDWADFSRGQWSNGGHLMKTIDEYLHSSYGVTLAAYGDGIQELSVWGYEYDDAGNYTGIWITDPKDNMSDLILLSVDLVGDLWYLDLKNDYGYKDWFIGEVLALDRNPVPEPDTFCLIGFGLIGVIVLRWRIGKSP